MFWADSLGWIICLSDWLITKARFTLANTAKRNKLKNYARQDEIGTPFCVTVDHESLEDNSVTVRDRDTWAQERVKIAELKEYLQMRLDGRN